jgi:hypothetical protein
MSSDVGEALVESRVIVIADTSQKVSAKNPFAGWKVGEHGWKVLKASIAILLILFLLRTPLNDARNRAGALLSVFPIGGAATETELDRYVLTGWDNASMVSAIDSIVPNEEGLLLFRMAEGYYIKHPYTVYYDPALTPVFDKPDVASLHAALLEKNLRWIMIPDYAVTEVNESVFGQLLATPSLAKISVSYGGYRLFRLNDGPEPFEAVPLASEDFTKPPPGGSLRWRIFSFSPKTNRKTFSPFARLKQTSSGLEIKSVRPIVRTGEATTWLTSDDNKPFVSPELRGWTDIPLAEGPVEVAVDVDGSGPFEVVLTTWRRGNQAPERRSLWQGTLLGEKKTIKAVYLDAGPLLANGDNLPRLHKLQFVLRGQGKVTIKNWRATLIKPPTPPFAGDPRWSPVEVGWALAGAIPPPPKGQFALTRLEGTPGGVTLRQELLDPIVASSPWMRVPANALGDEKFYREFQAVSGLYPTPAYAELILSGQGLVSVTLSGVCAGQQVDLDVVRAAGIDPQSRGRAARQEQIIAQIKAKAGGAGLGVGEILLTSEPTKVRLSGIFPCFSNYMRANITAQRNFYTIRRRPPRSSVSIHSLKMGYELRAGEKAERRLEFQSIIDQLAVVSNTPNPLQTLPVAPVVANDDVGTVERDGALPTNSTAVPVTKKQ